MWAAVAAAVCAAALSACGTGGSFAAPAPPPSSLMKAQIRSLAQVALNAIQSGVVGSLAARRGADGFPTPYTCVNRASLGLHENADGTTTQTTTGYYDDACTVRSFVGTYTRPTIDPPQSAVFASSFTQYRYDRSGNVTGYGSGFDSYGPNGFSRNSAFGPGPGLQPTSSFGSTCVFGPLQRCATASASKTRSGTWSGNAIDQTITTVSGIVSGSEALAAAMYVSVSPLTVVAGTTSLWTVTGAAPVYAVTGQAAFTIDRTRFGLGTVSMNLNDPVNGIALSCTAQTGILTMTIAQNGARIATLGAGTDGTGGLSYADDSMEPVEFFFIIPSS